MSESTAKMPDNASKLLASIRSVLSLLHHSSFGDVLLYLQSTGLVRHVFRLLAEAKREGRAVPWVLLENVSYRPAQIIVSLCKSPINLLVLKQQMR